MTTTFDVINSQEFAFNFSTTLTIFSVSSEDDIPKSFFVFCLLSSKATLTLLKSLI